MLEQLGVKTTFLDDNLKKTVYDLS